MILSMKVVSFARCAKAREAPVNEWLTEVGGFEAFNAAKARETGAAGGTRTPDPIITNDVLYQLSYCGFPSDLRKLATYRPFASLL